jgi:hypothetical protein
LAEFHGGCVDGPDLYLCDAPVDHVCSSEMGIGMKRLYVIHSLAYEEGDDGAWENFPIKAYVSAECPYEALFYFQNHFKKIPGIALSFEPIINLLDQEKLDPDLSEIGDVGESCLLDKVILSQGTIRELDESLAMIA